MTTYKAVLASGSDLLGELRALNLTVSLRLYDPSDVTFTVEGTESIAQLLEPLVSDIVVYRDGSPIFRGTVGATQDMLDGTSHYVSVNAVDYRGRLDRRILLADVNHNNEPDMDIAWDLIDTAQSETQGGMGISLGTVPASVDRKLTFLAGETVRGAIDRIANVDGGFDWDINPQLEFVAFRNGRGENRGRILDYGGLVSKVAINTDPTSYANAVRVVGDGTTAASVELSIPTGTPRFDHEVNLPTIDNQDLVDNTAVELLARQSSQHISYDLTLRDSPGQQAWGGLADIGLGDTIRIVVKSGRLDINVEERVFGLFIQSDGDGRELVTVEAGGQKKRIDDRARDNSRRIDDVELVI